MTPQTMTFHATPPRGTTRRGVALAAALAVGLAAGPARAVDDDPPIRIRTPTPSSILAAPGDEAPPAPAFTATPAPAAPPAAPAAPVPPPRAMAAPSTTTPPRLEEPPSWLTEIEAIAWWAWRGLGDLAHMIGRAFAPPSPGEVARQIRTGDSELWTLLTEAGYSLEEVRANIGLFSSAEASFRLTRDLSPADRDHVEDLLEQYSERNGGLSARLHRLILRELLDASEGGTYVVEKVDITLWPLPTARFSITPVASAPSLP